jgi:DNA replication protein DnaC
MEMVLKLYANVTGAPKRFETAGFINYVVNDTNKKQFNICKDYNGLDSLVLTGNTGTGKTHLAIAILKNFPMQPIEEGQAKYNKRDLEHQLEAAENKETLQKMLDEELYRYRAARCLFVSIIDVFLNINAAETDKKEAELHKYISNAYDCVCFDDLGVERFTDAARQNLYYIIDKRYGDMLPTIITSNLTIKEINDKEPRIASRLSEMGRILQFDGKDYRQPRNRDVA